MRRRYPSKARAGSQSGVGAYTGAAAGMRMCVRARGAGRNQGWGAAAGG